MRDSSGKFALLLVVTFLLAACSGSDPATSSLDASENADAAACRTTTLTWESFGAPFFLDHCTACHGSALPASQRRNAPVGVDFDSLDAVRRQAPRIRARAASEPPTMPPAGGTSLDERTRLAAWLDCGAPANADVVAPDMTAVPIDFGAPGDAMSAHDAAITTDLAAPARDGGTTLGVGKLCPLGFECGAGLFCLNDKLNALLPPDGYCSRLCSTDGDCGDDAFCGPNLGGAGRLCFQRCGPGDSCGAGRVCGKSISGFLDFSPSRACLPGDPLAREGGACEGFYDCNHDQACRANDFSAPGGSCVTLGCVLGDNTTCAPGGLCTDVGNNLHVCVPVCATANDCRVADGYACTSIPFVNVSACAFNAKPSGAACTVDTDCAPVGSSWRCLTGADVPNGYCSGARGTCDKATEATSCPEDAACYDPTPGLANADHFCAHRCLSDSDCRVADGYACKVLRPTDASSPKGCIKP